MHLSEKQFLQIISTLNVEVINKSHLNVPYFRSVPYLKEWSKTISHILLAYEVKLNEVYDIYPDYLLLYKGKMLRIEIKNLERERNIANQINSLSGIKENEFWYVLMNKKLDIEKIKFNANKRDKRIRIMYFDDDIVSKIKEYFKIK